MVGDCTAAHSLRVDSISTGGRAIRIRLRSRHLLRHQQQIRYHGNRRQNNHAHQPHSPSLRLRNLPALQTTGQLHRQSLLGRKSRQRIQVQQHHRLLDTVASPTSTGSLSTTPTTQRSFVPSWRISGVSVETQSGALRRLSLAGRNCSPSFRSGSMSWNGGRWYSGSSCATVDASAVAEDFERWPASLDGNAEFLSKSTQLRSGSWGFLPSPSGGEGTSHRGWNASTRIDFLPFSNVFPTGKFSGNCNYFYSCKNFRYWIFLIDRRPCFRWRMSNRWIWKHSSRWCSFSSSIRSNRWRCICCTVIWTSSEGWLTWRTPILTIGIITWIGASVPESNCALCPMVSNWDPIWWKGSWFDLLLNTFWLILLIFINWYSINCRTQCMRLFVAVTILIGSSVEERTAMLNCWIEIAIESKTALGNMYGFAGLLLGLCMPQV